MGWPYGDDWTCKGFAAFRNMNAFAAWMALASVAFSRSEFYLREIIFFFKRIKIVIQMSLYL